MNLTRVDELISSLVYQGARADAVAFMAEKYGQWYKKVGTQLVCRYVNCGAKQFYRITNGCTRTLGVRHLTVDYVLFALGKRRQSSDSELKLITKVADGCSCEVLRAEDVHRDQTYYRYEVRGQHDEDPQRGCQAMQLGGRRYTYFSPAEAGVIRYFIEQRKHRAAEAQSYETFKARCPDTRITRQQFKRKYAVYCAEMIDLDYQMRDLYPNGNVVIEAKCGSLG